MIALAVIAFKIIKPLYFLGANRQWLQELVVGRQVPPEMLAAQLKRF